MLNTRFVNTWVLLRELPDLQDGAKGAAAAALATKFQEHFVYPVDPMILTPELTFIQNLPTNEFIKSVPIAKEQKSQYLTWLKSSLAQVDSP